MLWQELESGDRKNSLSPLFISICYFFSWGTEYFFAAEVNSPLSMEKKSTKPGMNWKTIISAANPRKRMSRREVPFAKLPLAARAGAAQPSVTKIVLIRVLMASSF
jgi:hypothetical protein